MMTSYDPNLIMIVLGYLFGGFGLGYGLASRSLRKYMELHLKVLENMILKVDTMLTRAEALEERNR